MYQHCSDTLRRRQQMDHRWLEEAFLKYATLQVAGWYPSHISLLQLHLHEGLSETLTKITPLFHNAFISKYAGLCLYCLIDAVLCKWKLCCKVERHNF